MANVLAFWVPVVLEIGEGLRIIIAMLLTGLVFLAVVVLGDLSKAMRHRRRERRHRERLAARRY